MLHIILHKFINIYSGLTCETFNRNGMWVPFTLMYTKWTSQPWFLYRQAHNDLAYTSITLLYIFSCFLHFFLWEKCVKRFLSGGKTLFRFSNFSGRKEKKNTLFPCIFSQTKQPTKKGFRPEGGRRCYPSLSTEHVLLTLINPKVFVNYSMNLNSMFNSI